MQTLEQWRRFYDGWAGADPHLASTGRALADADFARLSATLSAWLGLSGQERLLDVGCASGTLTSCIGPRARDVVGVDFSHPLVRDAHVRHARAGLAFVQGEAAGLPFPDRSFDRVCCYNVLLSLPDHAYVEAALRELQRVARPAATILIGSLPDVRRKERFFDLQDARSAWYRRAVPRPVRWRLKRSLRPDSPPGETRILWFDVEELASRFRHEHWSVAVHVDPKVDDHHEYRSTLVLSRGVAHPAAQEHASRVERSSRGCSL